MTGKIDGGICTITFDINHEGLFFPNPQFEGGMGKFWPCDDCGCIRAVDYNVEAFICDECAAKRDLQLALELEF